MGNDVGSENIICVISHL